LTVSKLRRAEKMLLNGFLPAQISSRLKLSAAQVRELVDDLKDEPKKKALALEDHATWRQRKAEEVERKVVGIAEKHLDSLVDCEGLTPVDVGGFKDISGVAHKWLRAGESNEKVTRVNINMLAQVRPVEVGTPPTIELTPDATSDEP
jgi:hypothetical protein